MCHLITAAASRFSLWWHGDRRPQALTADTASGAGLQGGIEDDVPPSDGGAATAPSEGGDPRTDSNRRNLRFRGAAAGRTSLRSRGAR